MSQPPNDSDPTPLVELISRAQRGDKEAFNQLWKRTLEDPDLKFNAYLTYLERNKEERKDLAQNVALKVWQVLPRLENPGSYKVWLFKIANHTAIDSLRQRKSRPQVTSEVENDNNKSPTEPDIQTEKMELTMRALQTLPPKMRACLILSILGFTKDEIAEIVGISQKSVSTYLSESHAMIRLAYHALESSIQLPPVGHAKPFSGLCEISIKKLLGKENGSDIAGLFKELFGEGDESDER